MNFYSIGAGLIAVGTAAVVVVGAAKLLVNSDIVKETLRVKTKEEKLAEKVEKMFIDSVMQQFKAHGYKKFGSTFVDCVLPNDIFKIIQMLFAAERNAQALTLQTALRVSEYAGYKKLFEMME